MEDMSTLSKEDFISFSLSYIIELRGCDYMAFESTMKDLGMTDDMFKQYDENLNLLIKLGYVKI